MNDKQKFHHTISILVNAYMQGTLEHMDCAACAVGNIISASIKAEIYYDEHFRQKMWRRGEVRIEPIWFNLFITPGIGRRQRKWPHKYKGYVKKQVDATGYSWQDLAKIEKAFESVSCGDGNKDEWSFNGLMAVVDALAEIHNIDLSERESAKLLFVKS